MALTCTAESLAEAAACFNCDDLTSKKLRAIRIFLKCAFLNGESVNCAPKSLLASAIAAGFLNMSEKQQMAVETYLDCQITNGGGGGGGGAAPDSIAYPGPPVVNPPALQYIVVDSNYRQWQYGTSGWQ